MGQRIEVQDPVILGDVAVFVADRSFTGMEGARFESPADAESGEGIPAQLAAHLYASDEGVRHIHVAANTVTVGRVLEWNDTHLDTVARAIEEFFLFYPAAS